MGNVHAHDSIIRVRRLIYRSSNFFDLKQSKNPAPLNLFVSQVVDELS
jgi:hypothetical protein